MNTITNSTYQSSLNGKIVLSKHANQRSQQRGIKENCIPLLVAYGEKSYDGDGGIRYLMTSRAIQALRSVIGESSKIQSLEGVYAVMDSATGTTVITAGHRYK
jgi:hypothetical protein